MPLSDFIRKMPKVELHVHLEGSIRPETLLALAERNQIELPATSIEELREWYKFIDFPHFAEIYFTSAKCLRTPDDIELITREFLSGQAAQNIVHSEVTYTAYTQYEIHGIPFDDQLAAINRARKWGEDEFGITMSLTIDYPRHLDPQGALLSADWAIHGMGNGVTAFGLGGPEVDHPPEKFRAAFNRAHAAGLPCVPHAGETVGPESIWGALNLLHSVRIGHGVRCIEDPALVDVLRERQIPLEVCPTSNICLKVYDSMAAHSLPQLVDEGLYVTINSDDPPMFNTTLTDEFIAIADAFGYDVAQLQTFSLNALRASFSPDEKKQQLENRFRNEFADLENKYLV